MSRTVIRKAGDEEDDLPGTYRRVTDPSGCIKAIVWCPRCGGNGALRHEILADGDVQPSYVCPHASCDFHEWVRLEGWIP